MAQGYIVSDDTVLDHDLHESITFSIPLDRIMHRFESFPTSAHCPCLAMGNAA